MREIEVTMEVSYRMAKKSTGLRSMTKPEKCFRSGGDEMTLAERLDNFMREFDPYEYSHNDWSVEQTERSIKESPEAVINELLDILEDLEVRGQI